jgi:cardiolipin synthase
VSYPRITLHSLVILASILIYILTTRAARERRPPAVAIGWVLGLIALPYLVLPMYLMFGRRKMPRRQSRRPSVRSECKHWAEDLIESFDLPSAANATIRLHADGTESAAALEDLFARAQFSIDICTYILGDDPFGRRCMELMQNCVDRGVKVRLLLDGYGALLLPREALRGLEKSGVETAIFSPLFARKTQGPRNLRNHRKMTIVDRGHLWAGGRNLAAEYFITHRGVLPWGDLTFDLSGKVAEAAALQFEADWVAAGGKPASAETLEMLAAGIAVATKETGAKDSTTAAAAPRASLERIHRCTGVAQFLPSGPDQIEDTVHALLIDACFQARERILAVTPYFVPDESLETAMRLAARRGVRIDLCIPAVSNHRLADFVRNRPLRALARAGVKVHLLPAMNHAKGIVFDNSVALSGSVNLDSRSLLLNYECAVVFYGAAEIEWLADWIGKLMPGARAFDPARPNLLRDVAEGLLLSVAYQL